MNATLADYWMVLYSRRKLIFLVAFASMLITMAISYFLAPVYEAKASFYFPTNLIGPSYTASSQNRIAQMPLRPIPDEKEAGIHVGILRGNDMAERVRALFPDKSPAFFKKNVDFVTSPQFFTDIYVRDENPDVAAAIANSFVVLYRVFHAETLKENARSALVVLESQAKELRGRIDEKSADIRNYQLKHNLVSTAEIEERFLSQAKGLERQRDDNAVEIQAVRDRMGLPPRNEAPAERSDEEGVASDPRHGRLSRLMAKEKALTDQIGRLNSSARDTIGKLSAYNAMDGERKRLSDLLQNVELNLAEARLQAEFPHVEIVQVQTARPPKVPGFPLMTLNGLVAFIIGFVAGCYNALFLEYLRRLRLARIRRDLDLGIVKEAQA